MKSESDNWITIGEAATRKAVLANIEGQLRNVGSQYRKANVLLDCIRSGSEELWRASIRVPPSDPEELPGEMAIIIATGEIGRIVNVWWNEELAMYDTHVATYGPDWPTDHPNRKAVIVRYPACSLLLTADCHA